MIHNRFAKTYTMTLIVVCLVHGAKHGYGNDEFLAAIKNGTPSLNLRLSNEYSSLDETPKPATGYRSPANGLILQTRLGYRTGDFYHTNAFVQLQNVSNLVEDFAVSPAARRGTRHDFILDPDGNRVHQAYIDYAGIPDTRLRLGRQEIVLDDARFIGQRFWRQNGQSFDGASLVNRSLPQVEFSSALLSGVNTPALDQVVDSGRELHHLILVNAKLTVAETHHVTAFTYWLDTEVRTPAARDSVTYGARLDGICQEVVNYDITYATQDDYQDGEDHDGDLLHLYLGSTIKAVNVGVGYSRISGQDGAAAAHGRAFDTLFGNAHKWDGWADQFAATNGGGLPAGLEEWYFHVSRQLAGTTITIRYHLFDTSHEDAQYDGEYGDEIDLDITRKLTDNLSAQIQMAFYNESDKSKSGMNNPTADEDLLVGRVMYSF